jgi:hypothetical protein
MLAETIVRNENASAQGISEDQLHITFDGVLQTVGSEGAFDVAPGASLITQRSWRSSRDVRSSGSTLNGAVGCASTGRMMPDIGI